MKVALLMGFLSEQVPLSALTEDEVQLQRIV